MASRERPPTQEKSLFAWFGGLDRLALWWESFRDSGIRTSVTGGLDAASYSWTDAYASRAGGDTGPDRSTLTPNRPERDSGSTHAVPRRCTLEGFAEEVSGLSGVEINSLEPLSQLNVQTANTIYQLVVLDPFRSRVLVQGGRFFEQPCEAVLFGSSFGGHLLKMHWIGCGMRMEIQSDDCQIVTSPVRAVAVDDARDLPGPF